MYLRQYYLTLCIRWSTLRQLFSIVPETVLFDSVSGDQLWDNYFLLYLRQYYLTLCIRWSTLRELFSLVPETVLFDSVYQVINFEKTVFYCTWDSIIWLCVSGDQLWDNYFLLYLRQYYLTLCIRWSTLRELFSIVPETVLFDSVYQVINFETIIFYCIERQYYLTLCIRWSTLRQLFSIVPETVLFDSVYQVINFERIIFYCTWDSIIWLCVSGDQLWDNYFLLYLRQYYLTLCIRWSTLRQLFSIVPETVLFDSVYQVINFETIIFYCTWDSIIWLCVSGDQLWDNYFLLYLRQYYLTLCIRWSTLRELFSSVPETVLFDSVYQVINFETIIFYCMRQYYLTLCIRWSTLRQLFSIVWDSIIWLCVSGDQLWENYFLLYLRQYYLTLCIRWSFSCTWDSIIWLCVSGDLSLVPETVLFDSVYQVIFLLYLRQYYLTLCIRWSFSCTWDSIIWLCVSGDQLWENYFLLYLRQYYLTLCIRWSTCRMRWEPSMWRPWAWGWTHRPQARPSWTVSWTHLDPVGLSLDLNVQRSRDVSRRCLESVCPACGLPGQLMMWWSR